VITPASVQQNWIVCRFRNEIWAKMLKKNNKIVADGLCTAKYEIFSRTGEMERERERATCACWNWHEEWECTVPSATGTTWSGSPLWKEATAAMTALVYSILHTRIYRGYVHVYWPRVHRYTRRLTKRVSTKWLFSKIFFNSALSEMLKNIMNILRNNFLTVRDKKLPRVKSSWKSPRKLWLKFQLNRSIFMFSSLKG
jgi:hypothetical protein